MAGSIGMRGLRSSLMNTPRTLTDLQALISTRVQEDLHLDYKESLAISEKKRAEIAKDVSAFANSDGGMIVYGIVEQNHLPVRVDDGVIDDDFDREWLENVITSNISPRIDGLEIHPIEVSAGRSAYAVVIPKSWRGPHQESSKRYYKRFNFKAEPMEDYEISDVRNRRDVITPLVSVDIDLKRWIMYLAITNIGDIAAEDVQFTFTPEMPEELAKSAPHLLSRGCKFLPPGKRYRFWYGSALEKVHADVKRAFDIEVSYFNRRVATRVSDSFHIDPSDYSQTALIDSEAQELGEVLKKGLESLTKAVASAKDVLEDLTSIAGPSGLALSRQTLKNLQGLRDGNNEMEKIDAHTCRAAAFREVLGVDMPLAYALRQNFRMRYLTAKNLDTVELHGLTPEVIKMLKENFIIEDE